MRPKSLSSPHRRLREAFLTLLWSQWTALGVAGSFRTPIEGCIDPEALILVTTSQARHDPRLLDEMIDWLMLNGSLINVQRLRNARDRLGLGDPRILGAIGEILSARAEHSKWKSLAVKSEDVLAQAAEPEALYFDESGRPLPSFGKPEEVFRQWGYLRGAMELRGKSLPPSSGPASNLLIKLRALFGLQARCEVLLWLLLNKSGRPADMAAASFYFGKTVENALKEMAGSGLVREAKRGRELTFAIEPGTWSFLRSWESPAGFPDWVDWARRFTVIERLLEVLARDDLDGWLKASELRRVLDQLESTLVEGRLLGSFPRHAATPHERYERVVRDQVGRLMGLPGA